MSASAQTTTHGNRWRPALLSALAVPVVFLLVVGNPLEVSAAGTSYYKGDSAHGVWRGSPTVSTTGNAAQAQLNAATVTVDNGASATSGQSAATQTYSRRSVPVYCRWTHPAFTKNTAPLSCQITK